MFAHNIFDLILSIVFDVPLHLINVIGFNLLHNEEYFWLQY